MQKKSYVNRWIQNKTTSNDVVTGFSVLKYRGLEISILKFSLAVVVVFGLFDIAEDISHGSSTSHIAIDSLLMTLIAGAILVLLTQTRTSSAKLQSQIDLAQKNAKRAIEEKNSLQRGLGDYISNQLEMWSLSVAEKEIALLLIKGLSHKEIAEIRSTSERTVRQQSQSIYSKAGLKGRTELSAFFLEDLLAPIALTRK